MRARLQLLALLVLLQLSGVFGGFYYTLNGTSQYATATQLWYDGLWKEIGWVNGSTIRWPTNQSIEGKLLIVDEIVDWRQVEPFLRSIAAKRPLAMLYALYRPGGDATTPGVTMYLGCDGQDRKPIDYPIAEIRYFGAKDNWTALPDGTYLEVNFEVNKWKTVLDTHVEAIIAAFISLWEALIIIGGAYRIWQFYMASPSFSFLSIGPLCLLFEIISSCIRFVHTIGDPFWTLRLYGSKVQFALLTIHLPFSFSSGVLLTMFWAETLTKSNVQATPFITRYRWITIAVIAVVFCMEIIVTTARLLTPGSTLYSAFIVLSIVTYLVIALLLTISFLICAIGIWRRISGSGSANKHQLRSFTLRFGSSIFGYLLTTGFILGVGINGGRIYPFLVIYNMLYISVNFTSSLQVWALQPLRIRRVGTTSKKGLRSGLSATSNSLAGAEPDSRSGDTAVDEYMI